METKLTSVCLPMLLFADSWLLITYQHIPTYSSPLQTLLPVPLLRAFVLWTSYIFQNPPCCTHAVCTVWHDPFPLCLSRCPASPAGTTPESPSWEPSWPWVGWSARPGCSLPPTPGLSHLSSQCPPPPTPDSEPSHFSLSLPLALAVQSPKPPQHSRCSTNIPGRSWDCFQWVRPSSLSQDPGGSPAIDSVEGASS